MDTASYICSEVVSGCRGAAGMRGGDLCCNTSVFDWVQCPCAAAVMVAVVALTVDARNQENCALTVS